MNAESKLILLRNELGALKNAFARKASDLIVYSYSTNVEVNNPETIFTVTFLTEDGSNTIASIETNTYSRRIPFNGGARWYVALNKTQDITIRSMKKGSLVVS